MDGNNWRPAAPGGEAPVDGGDWRATLQADSRQRIVNKIMETLKRHLPFSGQEGLQELKKIAVRFEEKIYSAATSQPDYLRKISLKMLTMETKSQNSIPNSLPPGSAGMGNKPPDLGASPSLQPQVHSQGQSLPIPLPGNQAQGRQQLLSQNMQSMTSTGVQGSAGLPSSLPPVSGINQTPINVVGQNGSMQTMSNVAQNPVGTSMGQGVPQNMFGNPQRQMPGRQQVMGQQQQQHQSQNPQHYLYQQQQYQQQLLKRNQAHPQPQQNVMQTTQLQQPQQSGMQTSSVMQPSVMQSAPMSSLPQNQLSSIQQSAQSNIQHHAQSVIRQQQLQQQGVGIHPQQTQMMQQQLLSTPQQPQLLPTQPQQQHQQPQQQQQPMQSQQQLAGQQANASTMQQNQFVGQQNNIGDMQQQQRFLSQQTNHHNLQQQQQIMTQQSNLSGMHQQQLGTQGNFSGLQQPTQQQLLGTQSGNSSMQNNQHAVNMLQQQPKASLPQQTQQNSPNLLPTQGQQTQSLAAPQQLVSQIQSQPGQLQQQHGLQQQSNPVQREMQQRMQTSGQAPGSLVQPQNVIDQQKQLYQSQRVLPETSSTSLDSTAQTGQANGSDWQEEVYQKIKTMKEMYLPELNEMYQKIAAKLQQHDSLPQQPKTDQLEKLKMFKNMLERMLAFLQVQKNSVLISYKEKLSSYERQIITFLNTNRPRKPMPPMQQGQHPSSHMQSLQQPSSQINQAQPHENQMNPQLQSMTLQSSVSSMQQNNNMSSMQHSLSGVSKPQQNMMNSLQAGSNLDSGQGNAMASPQQGAVGSLQQHPSSSQPANLSSVSSQGGQTMMQPSLPLQSNSNSMFQHQHLKQQQPHEQQILQSQQFKQQYQQRQMQQQLMQKQHMLQQQQHHQQLQHHQQQQQQQLNQQVKQQQQMPQLHQINDVNEVKIRQGLGVKAGVFQQHLSSGQRGGYPHQQMKSGTSFPISSPQLLQTPSPQLPQHSSPQIDQQNLLSSLPGTGTPLQSANSPFVVPSPSTPLAPSPMPGDSEKLGISSLSNAGNVGHQQPSSLAIGTPGISASPLLAEFSVPDGAHGNVLTTVVSSKSNVSEQPFDRLIKAVKSISPKALNAAVSDIGSVVSMIDRIAGSAPGNGTRAAVGEDLVAMTKCRLQARNVITQEGISGTRKMKRYTSALPLNVVSSAGGVSESKQLSGPETSDLESTAKSDVKRPRLEANHALLEEIREINQGLIDTVVDISDEDVNPTAVTAAAAAEGSGEGTLVKCSFSAVALSPNLKSQYDSAQMSPIQPLRLLVPTNYPNCSPILLDKLPVEVSKEYEDLSVKAKSRFNISLRSLSQPMSLGEIVRTWDICARAVISEHAQQSGGGSFSSKYGTWENCLSAA